MKALNINLLLISLLLMLSCSSDNDFVAPLQPETETINNPDQDIDSFIWRGLNTWYLYKDDVPDLANDKFTSTTSQDFLKFLSDFDSPEDTFESLLARNQDRFSWIVDDYIALEQSFDGISKSNGMNIIVLRETQGSDNLVGVIRYILPGTDAESKGLNRGDAFNTVNGTRLTVQNVNNLLGLDSYTIGLMDGSIVDLTKIEYTEDPIYIAKTIEYQGLRIGYLMYNQFVGGLEIDLNNVFNQFKMDMIDELIIDLRYNGGGSGFTTTSIASMITGNNTGEVFFRSTLNSDLQVIFDNQDPEQLINRFIDVLPPANTPINSLGLSKVHILTTGSSASASELLINGLIPYMNVVQIGGTTAGKFQGSITLYDSPNFTSKEGVNQDHNYAMQPLILKGENSLGTSDFINGLVPNIEFFENYRNLGVLGEVDEPLLKTALDFIANGTTAAQAKSQFLIEEIIAETKMFTPGYQTLNIDTIKLPE